jgi:hypothetical protein
MKREFEIPKTFKFIGYARALNLKKPDNKTDVIWFRDYPEIPPWDNVAAVCVDESDSMLFVCPIQTAEKTRRSFRFRFEFPEKAKTTGIGSLLSLRYWSAYWPASPEFWHGEDFEDDFRQYGHEFKKPLELYRARMRFYREDPDRQGKPKASFTDDYFYIAKSDKKIFSTTQGFKG